MATKTTKAKAPKAPKAEKAPKKDRAPAMKPFLLGLPEEFIVTAKKVAAKNDKTLRGMFRELLVKGVEKLAA
jgi:hypothetical protein